VGSGPASLTAVRGGRQRRLAVLQAATHSRRGGHARQALCGQGRGVKRFRADMMRLARGAETGRSCQRALCPCPQIRLAVDRLNFAAVARGAAGGVAGISMRNSDKSRAAHLLCYKQGRRCGRWCLFCPTALVKGRARSCLRPMVLMVWRGAA